MRGVLRHAAQRFYPSCCTQRSGVAAAPVDEAISVVAGGLRSADESAFGQCVGGAEDLAMVTHLKDQPWCVAECL
ncbi:MAG: hypothetical protein OHK0050_08590 [Roseiflexaceae bacterium]